MRDSQPYACNRQSAGIVHSIVRHPASICRICAEMKGCRWSRALTELVSGRDMRGMTKFPRVGESGVRGESVGVVID